MRQLARFWLVVGGLVVSFVSTGYLFVSFISPEAGIVATAPEARIVATLVAVVAVLLSVWVAMLSPGRDRNFPERQE